MKGRRLNRGGKTGGGRTDLRGEAQYPKAGQAIFVHKEMLERGEARLDGQDVRGGAGETILGPPLDLVPEGRELPRHMNRGLEGVRPIAEDGEEEGGGQSMTQERQEANSWRGESFNRHEGSLGFGQSFGKVGGRGDRWGEPVAQPPDLVLGMESGPI